MSLFKGKKEEKKAEAKKVEVKKVEVKKPEVAKVISASVAPKEPPVEFSYNVGKKNKKI